MKKIYNKFICWLFGHENELFEKPKELIIVINHPLEEDGKIEEKKAWKIDRYKRCIYCGTTRDSFARYLSYKEKSK